MHAQKIITECKAIKARCAQSKQCLDDNLDDPNATPADLDAIEFALSCFTPMFKSLNDSCDEMIVHATALLDSEKSPT